MHPHGILGVSVWANFLSNGGGFDEQFHGSLWCDEHIERGEVILERRGRFEQDRESVWVCALEKKKEKKQKTKRRITA